jgi:hypothetical protein
MGLSDQVELGEIGIILGAVIVIGYAISRATGSLADAAKSVTTAVGNAASSARDAVGGLAPTQTLPSSAGGVTVGKTGQTVSDLLAAGYTQEQIDQMIAQGGLVMTAPVGCCRPDLSYMGVDCC